MTRGGLLVAALGLPLTLAAPTFAQPSGVPSGSPVRMEPIDDPVAPRRDSATPMAVFQLSAAAGGIAHFPATTWDRSVEEAVDGVYGAGVFLGTSFALLGVVVERVGLGKDHFRSSGTVDTLDASYGADVLSLSLRKYFTGERPSFFLEGDLGAALPTVRASGSRPGAMPFVSPPTVFTCTDFGRVGASLSLIAGGEIELGKEWTLLGALRVHGLLLSRSGAAFDGCGPGTGPAIGGALQLGFAYRWDL